jgi:hypothetical protein
MIAWHWLRHPLVTALVQVLAGLLLAYLLTERWQRWRQRRDFQHKTLVKFSELSFEMMDRLSELLVLRGRMATDQYAAKQREQLSRWTAFVSMRGEVMAAFGHAFIKGRAYQGVFNNLNALRAHVNAAQPVPLDRFEPDQEKFLAYREAVVAHMVRAMGLLPRPAWKSELDSAEARVQAAEERLAAMTAPRRQDSPDPSSSSL